MELKLTRIKKTPEFTGGTFNIDGRFFAYTAEDAIRDIKIAGRTAIPYGRYRVLITYSNRFQKHLPLLLDVPGYSGVRIHSGNTAEDTEGCILLGLTELKDGVGNSRAAMAKFMPILEAGIKEGDVWLTVS